MHAVFPLPISYIKPSLSSSFFFTDVFTGTARQVRMYSNQSIKQGSFTAVCGSVGALMRFYAFIGLQCFFPHRASIT